MSWFVSQGKRVPSPTRRVQAQSLSQPTVRSNSTRTSGGTSAMSFKWSLDLVLPPRVAVFQEPLVVEDLHLHLVTAPADDRAVIELVH